MSEDLTTPLEQAGADVPATPQTETVIEHIVTADDLQSIPELEENGVEVGETILLHPKDKLTPEQLEALENPVTEAAGVELSESDKIELIPAGEAITGDVQADALAQFVPSKEPVQLNGLPQGQGETSAPDTDTPDTDTLTSETEEVNTPSEADGKPWLNPNNP